jgi:hypothetical protein
MRGWSETCDESGQKGWQVCDSRAQVLPDGVIAMWPQGARAPDSSSRTFVIRASSEQNECSK